MAGPEVEGAAAAEDAVVVKENLSLVGLQMAREHVDECGFPAA